MGQRLPILPFGLCTEHLSEHRMNERGEGIVLLGKRTFVNVCSFITPFIHTSPPPLSKDGCTCPLIPSPFPLLPRGGRSSSSSSSVSSLVLSQETFSLFRLKVTLTSLMHRGQVMGLACREILHSMCHQGEGQEGGAVWCTEVLSTTPKDSSGGGGLDDLRSGKSWPFPLKRTLVGHG